MTDGARTQPGSTAVGGPRGLGSVHLSAAQREAAQRAARDADARLGLRAASAPYAAHAYDPSMRGWPTLHMDDVSGIPFLDDIAAVEFYQLRARVRARSGDLFAATCPDLPAYERYNRDTLGLGDPAFVYAPPSGPAIAVAEACRHGAAFAEIVAFATRAGRLLIHPYMGIEAVWDLAADVARAAGVPVGVVAPPPPVTWFANDKRHLTALAQAAAGEPLGVRVAVDTRVGAAPGALASELRALAGAHRRVALKMTRCASAMGNEILSSADVQGWGDAELRAQVERFLAVKQWVPGDPVLAVAWEDATVSPSTQLWIPHPAEGAPRVEGIYEQLLVGDECVFLGSVPADPTRVPVAALEQASLLVAEAYQALGYVGRCSFDFILPDGAATGDDPGLRFVECNGRWGGTSTPMALVDRLFPDARPAYRARDVAHEALVGQTFEALASRLGDALYDARTGRGRFILYNLGCLAPAGKLDVIALGPDMAAATRALEEELPLLLGLL